MTPLPLLSVRKVSVSFRTAGRSLPAVTEVSYSVAAGEVVAVVGESGSGKTVTAMSLLGLLPPDTAAVSGSALLLGRDLFTLDREQLRAVRGNEVGFVFQEPMTALNPVLTVGAQLVEAITTHQPVTRRAARARALELLALVGLPDPQRKARAYPHELSGGQLQRVVIAIAIANEPALLIADEPTTALDVTVQAEILELLRDLRDRLGIGILLITHDMGVVADLADRVVVMRAGRVVEEASVAELFAAPREEYTRRLLDAVLALPAAPSTPTPGTGPVVVEPAPPPVADPRAPDAPDSTLSVRNLRVTYRGRFDVPAVDGVSLHVAAGEVYGLVGESGSGKSTIASAITGLVRPDGGTVRLSGDDLAALRGKALRRARGRIGVVFQDPASSLNPRATIADSVAEPLHLHTSLRGSELNRRVDELLDAAQLATSTRHRFPHELSGGQRQRVGIARSIALDPELLIADEPTSSLDVSVQARILDLFRDLQAHLRFACLFISHDLAVIGALAARVGVMHRGRIVEEGTTAEVLQAPQHHYTQRLVASAPVADPTEQRHRRELWHTIRAE